MEHGSEQNVGVNLQQTRLFLHENVFMYIHEYNMNTFPFKMLPDFLVFSVEMDHGPTCLPSKTHTAAVRVFSFPPADSISISRLLHYNSVPDNVIHTISLRENSTIVNSASLRDSNVRPDGFPEINIFKVAQQLYSILIWRYQQQK